jgi:hypothetical protein
VGKEQVGIISGVHAASSAPDVVQQRRISREGAISTSVRVPRRRRSIVGLVHLRLRWMQCMHWLVLTRWSPTGGSGWSRTDDRGGMRLCEDRAALIMGWDGRWHRMEECDDGNEVGGDGCSAK